ncbi:MAG: phosphoribosylformylglycinamidine synthase subunit PurQ [Alphaproteobacteria bacterium]|nr:phosphoribosylformylglycinamidine synthase subunit PurQ [Alphaproteobacteria bacterium]
MRIGIIVFPGSNRENDVYKPFDILCDIKPLFLWHQDTNIPPVDLIVVPGGFSYGDYLRAGAIAARSPIMKEVIRLANKGTPVLGICNGFQILIESGLLPGILLRNTHLKFICKIVKIKVVNNTSIFTHLYQKDQIVHFPVAHHDGNYYADHALLNDLEQNDQIAFQYIDNPNGSIRDIAGIYNKQKNVLGLMPHPENVAYQGFNNIEDGRALFQGLIH